MIVVFDSNIWLSQLGLRSGSAAAAKFFINHQRATLAIPEVVRLEVEHNLRNDLTEYIEEIRTNHRKLLTIFGALKEVVLPTNEEVEAKLKEVFESVDVPKKEVPFTLESARSSFMKAIDKVPPSHKIQQFKDGVVWADCMKMLAEDSVVLVTDDKMFYHEESYEKGLALNLRAEAAQLPHHLTIIRTISDLLQAIRVQITINEEALADAFLESEKKSITGTLTRNGFDLGTRLSLAYTLFATENPKMLFLEFEMAYSCSDVQGEGRRGAVLHLKGDGFHEPSSQQFTLLRNFGERLSYQMPDGAEKETRNHVIFAAGLAIGHKEVTNTVRYKLEN
jgi:PIN domain-containing protein